MIKNLWRTGSFVMVLALLIASGTFAYASQPAPDSTADYQDGEALPENIEWYEMGLTINYPADWNLTFDERFDFVLLGPQDDEGNFPYMLVQSGSYNATEQSTDEFMASVVESASSAEDLSTTTFGETEGYTYQTTSDTEQFLLYAGFEHAPGQFGFLSFVAPPGTVDEWSPVFEQILESITVAPLNLDSEMLNAQLQQSLENEGTLIVGDPDAPILMSEFYDFSCPHCITYSHKANRMVEDYVMDGDLRIEFAILDIIGGELSNTAARVQICATQAGVGWDVMKMIYGAYERDGRAGYEQENLLSLIEESEPGIDISEMETCIASEETGAIIEANVARASELGVTSTPTLMFGTSLDDVSRVTHEESGVEFHGNFPLMIVYEYLDSQLDTQE